jgi:hypothetical protein
MGKVYNFDNKNEETESCCPFCDLAEEFTIYVSQAESNDEVFEILRSLVSEASKLTLIDFLQKEIQNNADLLDHLLYDNETEH